MSAGPLRQSHGSHVQPTYDTPLLSAQFMNELMKAPAQSVSPSSPVTTGTAAATGATWDTQQFTLPHVLNWYMCSEAASWPVESAGRCASQPLRSFDHARPPAITGCVAPVPRTALSNDCMPADVHAALTPLPELMVHPFNQHAHGSLVAAFPV